MCVAAGITIAVAAFLPWANVDGDNFYGLQMHMYQPFAIALGAGAALVVFGFLRTVWGGAAGLLGAFAVTIVVLMVHEGVYAGLNVLAIPAEAIGSHVSGYGEYALFAAGLLAGAAGVVTVIQREPPVVTRPERPLDPEGFTLTAFVRPPR
jgi:hypothetical protein